MPRLDGVTNMFIQRFFFCLSLSHEKWGAPQRRVARARVARLPGVSFLPVNAEGGVPHLTWVIYL